MERSSTENWDYNCTYELKPKALTGLHQVLQLETMLISLATRPGGMMHDVVSAKNSISLGVHIELGDKACFDRMELSAYKWGFFHMGRFSNYYKELFEETPYETLKRTFNHEKTFTGECVERQEEID